MLVLAVIDAIDNAIHNWFADYNWPAEYVGRLLLAALAGGLVGLEREVRGRQAGFRTNLLVCVGSAMTMIVSISFASRAWSHDSNVVLHIDPARIAYGIMTGIGFLGAGAIVKSGVDIRGLTTAAAMWCVAAVGMAAGFGLYMVTLIGTLLIVVALWLLEYLEHVVPKIRYRTVVVRRPWKAGVIQETIDRFKAGGLHVVDSSMERAADDLAHASIMVRCSFIRPQKYYAFERQLETDPGYEILSTREE